ncbi:hypothetical protein PILCRDRAFT_87817 [Piloderma croceum F 1598]|uniref:Uncharacterized protein n=1 Tax=Piloderma croceum (strain F 1598) TaxID=765440 RepID=A0A0C3FW89_PILCF|nr:hypothetical protein PILCRDRAFT_87817 [Piloderma croceum F 1598]
MKKHNSTHLWDHPYAFCLPTLDILHNIRRLDGQLVLPPYRKPLDLINHHEVEGLILRTARLGNLCNQGVLFRKAVKHLDVAQTVTWLHLVNGRWLFVASSDNYTKCFLPGPEKMGQIEVQPEGLVIALGVGLTHSAIHLLSLRRHLHMTTFIKLDVLHGLSHVQLLSGGFIACSLQDDVSIPQLVNWKNGSWLIPRTEDNITLSMPAEFLAFSRAGIQLSYVLEHQIDSSGDLSLSPSFWAYPQIDFDEALGSLAVGKTFGELAIYDYIGFQPSGLWSISEDFTTTCTSIGSAIYTICHETLCLPRECLLDGWSMDWPEWWYWNDWLGFPGDQAWLLEEAFGYLEQPTPLAFKKFRQTFLRAGGLYLIMDCEDDDILWNFHPDSHPIQILEDIWSDAIAVWQSGNM